MNAADLLFSVFKGKLTATSLRNLADAVSECEEVATYPASILVLEYVAYQVAERWDSGPVPRSEAAEIEAIFERPITALLNGLSAGGDSDEVWERTRELARAYLEWRARNT